MGDPIPGVTHVRRTRPRTLAPHSYILATGRRLFPPLIQALVTQREIHQYYILSPKPKIIELRKRNEFLFWTAFLKRGSGEGQ